MITCLVEFVIIILQFLAFSEDSHLLLLVIFIIVCVVIVIVTLSPLFLVFID